MVDVGLIEVNSRTLKRIEDNDEAVKVGLLTARGETSAQRRYTRLGCAVCRNRPHGDGDSDGIILWNLYTRACWAAVAIGCKYITVVRIYLPYRRFRKLYKKTRLLAKTLYILLRTAF